MFANGNDPVKGVFGSGMERGDNRRSHVCDLGTAKKFASPVSLSDSFTVKTVCGFSCGWAMGVYGNSLLMDSICSV